MARRKSRLSRTKGHRQGTHKVQLAQRALATAPTSNAGVICDQLLDRCGCGDLSAIRNTRRRGQEYGEVSLAFANWLVSVIGQGPCALLDFGCGRGRLCLQLALLSGSRQWKVDGIEIVDVRTHHFRRLMASFKYLRGRQRLAAAKLHLAHGDGLALDFTPYDVIFVNNLAFPHGPRSLTAALQEKLRRELRPGARVISTLPLALDGGRSETLRVPLQARTSSHCARPVLERVYLYVTSG